MARTRSKVAGSMLADPVDAGQGAQRKGLTALLVELALEPFGLQFADLRFGAAVDIGAGPDLLAGAVIEDDGLAHAGRADRANLVAGDAGLIERLADAADDALPVDGGIEGHGAGHAGLGDMRPLLLADADAAGLPIEDDGTDAARAGVDHQQIVAQLFLPRMSRAVVSSVTRMLISLPRIAPRIGSTFSAPAAAPTMLGMRFSSSGFTATT